MRYSRRAGRRTIPPGGLSARERQSGFVTQNVNFGNWRETYGPTLVEISKSVTPGTLPEPGGPVLYTVTIHSLATDTTALITSVLDNYYGDLADALNPTSGAARSLIPRAGCRWGLATR